MSDSNDVVMESESYVSELDVIMEPVTEPFEDESPETEATEQQVCVEEKSLTEAKQRIVKKVETSVNPVLAEAGIYQPIQMESGCEKAPRIVTNYASMSVRLSIAILLVLAVYLVGSVFYTDLTHRIQQKRTLVNLKAEDC